MRRDYHCWHSPHLGRDMELLVFGHAGARVLVFPTRAGRFYEYEDRGMVAALRHSIQQGHIQLFCVDSMDAESFYCFWKNPADRLKRHIEFENYILDEVLPMTQRLNPNPFLIAHGCSLGAFHAVNIALRHPFRFGRVVAFSGRYDLTLAVEEFSNLFDGHYDEEVYFHTPSHFVPNIEDDTLLQQMRHLSLTLTIGDQDPFYDNARCFSHALWNKGIAHDMHVWQGRAHRFRDWRTMAPHYL